MELSEQYFFKIVVIFANFSFFFFCRKPDIIDHWTEISAEKIVILRSDLGLPC